MKDFLSTILGLTIIIIISTPVGLLIWGVSAVIIVICKIPILIDILTVGPAAASIVWFFICCIIGLIYVWMRLNDYGDSNTTSSSPDTVYSTSDSIITTDSNDYKHVDNGFFDGRGNWRRWGEPYQDAEGYWRKSNDPFIDGQGRWRKPGEEWQDAEGRYYKPGEVFKDGTYHNLEITEEELENKEIKRVNSWKEIGEILLYKNYKTGNNI